MLTQGDTAPWFQARSSAGRLVNLNIFGGQYVVLSFLGSSTFGAIPQLIQEIERQRAVFDAIDACFIGISIDPDDERQKRLQPQSPGLSFLWDFDASISRMYDAARSQGRYIVHSLVLDPNLRVLAFIPMDGDGTAHARRIVEVLQSVPPVKELEGLPPILVLPHIFEVPLCKALIDRHATDAGEGLGYATMENGRAVNKYDNAKRRARDWIIKDRDVISVLESRLRRRLFPQVEKVFQYSATQIEDFVVARYDAAEGGETGGFFVPHRDNTNPLTAFRKFAVTIALNSGEYDGGGLHFPEYSSRGFHAPTGGAIVFSCSLMHGVRPVTRGKRFVCPLFIFDDEAAKLRDQSRLAHNPAK